MAAAPKGTGVQVSAAASATTIAATRTDVAVGDLILVYVAQPQSSKASITLSDDKTGGSHTYTALGSSVDRPPSDDQSIACFGCIALTTQSLTVTATYGASEPFRGIWIELVSGASALPTGTAIAGQGQATPGAGADAISSGNTTPGGGASAWLIAGLSVNCDTITPAPGVGTGFTIGINGWDFGQGVGNGGTSEFKRVTSSAAVAATFTSASNKNYLTIGLAIPEAAATPANTQSFKPAAIPTAFALPPGFISMPNMGAGLRLQTPAVALFQARKTAAPVTQPSVTVSVMALTLAGQAIKGREAALITPEALTLGFGAVKGREAAVVGALPLALAGQAVKGREAAVLGTLPLVLAGQAVKGREAAKLAPLPLVLGGGSTKAQVSAKLAPEALTLSFAAVKGRQGAAVQAEALTLGGGATKAKLTAAIGRLPLTLTFAAVNTATGGSSSVIVSPMLLSFAGHSIKAQLAGKLTPEALAISSGTVRGGRGAAVQAQALTLGAGAVKGRQSAALQAEQLTLGGGAVKAKLTVAVVRLPLTLAFANVSTQASGGATLQVAPMLVTLQGQAVKGRLLVRIAPLQITETWSTVHLPGDVVFQPLPGRAAFASPRRRVDFARTRSSS